MKHKVRNVATKGQQFKKINKKAAIFDDKERSEYLKGMRGSKQKRKEEYVKMRDEKHKRLIREQKAKIREEKNQQIDRLQAIIDQNNQAMKKLSAADKVHSSTEQFKTVNNQDIKVTTTFFK